MRRITILACVTQWDTLQGVVLTKVRQFLTNHHKIPSAHDTVLTFLTRQQINMNGVTTP